MIYKNFKELQKDYISEGVILAQFGEEIPLEMFEPFANSFLEDYQNSVNLFRIQQDRKQEMKEVKFLKKLRKKSWKKRIYEKYLKENQDVFIENYQECQGEVVDLKEKTKIESTALVKT